jgi:hypothetical protein
MTVGIHNRGFSSAHHTCATSLRACLAPVYNKRAARGTVIVP